MQSLFRRPRFLGVFDSSDGKCLIVRVETPGVEKRDIAVHLEGEDTLKIDVIRGEFKFENKIFLGSADAKKIDTENISARYENGLLEVFLPKIIPPEKPPRKIAIQSKL